MGVASVGLSGLCLLSMTRSLFPESTPKTPPINQEEISVDGLLKTDYFMLLGLSLESGVIIVLVLLVALLVLHLYAILAHKAFCVPRLRERFLG